MSSNSNVAGTVVSEVADAVAVAEAGEVDVVDVVEDVEGEAVRSVVRPVDESRVDARESNGVPSPGGDEVTALEPSAPPTTQQVAESPPVTALQELRNPSPAPVVDVSSLTVEQQAKMWRDTVASGGSLRAKT